jgi:hypothetical protein
MEEPTEQQSHPSQSPQGGQSVINSSNESSLSGTETNNRGWVSWKLKLPCFIVMLFAELVIITTLIVTFILSERNNGIATVNNSKSVDISTSFLTATIKTPSSVYSLLWTSLPSLIMSSFGLLWGIFVIEFGVRQPFVTLFKGGSARKTILLDYRFDGDIWGIMDRTIWRNKHWAFSIATILTFSMPIILVPLSSQVYQSRSTKLTSKTSLVYSHSFNDSTTDSPDLLGPFAVASAINTYGSTSPPWMDHLYAYPPFSSSSLPSNGSIMVNTTAYSALLDCQIMGLDDYTSSTSENMTTVKVNDRGCTTSQEIIPVQSSGIYSSVYPVDGCTEDAQFSRLGLIAGVISPNLVISAVVSCIPSYWTSNGTLEVSLRANATPLVSSYQNTTEWNSFRPFYSNAFEHYLADYGFIDPTKSLDGNQFGSIVYQYSTIKGPNKPLDPATLMEGMENNFPSIHAAYASTNLFVPSQSTTIQGILSQSLNRIIVVPVTCIILILLMVFIMISNIQLFIKATRDKTMLSEEPIGLLSMTALALDHNNDDSIGTEGISVPNFITQFRQENPGVKDIRAKVLKEYDIDNSFCSYNSSTGAIRIEKLVRRPNTRSRVKQS